MLIPLLPPIIAIILVFITKKPIRSLAIGCAVGLFAISGFTTKLFTKSFSIIFNIVTDPWNIKLIIALFLLGSFTGLLEFAVSKKRIKSKLFNSKKRVLFMGWLSGMFFFIDDYFNILLNGIFMNSLAAEHKISKAKIAFIVHSLGVSSCVLIPFSTWVIYIISIMQNSDLGLIPFKVFLESIPLNFYPICLLVITLAAILFEIDILKMKEAENKSEPFYPTLEKEELHLKHLLIPPLFLILSIAALTIYELNFSFTIDSLQNVDFITILVISSMISLVFGAIYYYSYKLLTKKTAIKSIAFGAKQMTSVIFILFFAWLLGAISKDLGTAQTVIELSKGLIGVSTLIIISFVLTSILSFLTSSWATFAIVIPILLPMAIHLGVNPAIVLAGIISGGVFGDHNSPISSTTIMTKGISKIEINEHFRTQIPYSAISFIMCFYLFFLMGVYIV